MKKTMHVLGAVTLGALLLTSCGNVSTDNVDHELVLDEARAHFIDAALAEVKEQSSGTTTIALDGNATLPVGSGSFTANIVNQSLLGEDSTLSGSVALKGKLDAQSMFGDINVDLDAELRYFNSVYYMILNTFTAQSESADIQAELDVALEQLAGFMGSWYMVDLADEAFASSGFDFEQITQLQLSQDLELSMKVLESMKNHNFFEIVEVLPSEGTMYVYKVRPHAKELTEMLKEITMLVDPEMTISDEEVKEMEESLAMLGDEQITHKLYINSEDHMYSKFTSEGSIVVDEEDGITFDLNLETMFTGGSNLEAMLTVHGENKALEEDLDLNFSVESKEKDASMKMTFMFPAQNIEVALNAMLSFEAGTPEIVTPEGAMNLVELLGASAMMDEVMMDDTVNPMDESIMNDEMMSDDMLGDY